jgi:hypothetical protein
MTDYRDPRNTGMNRREPPIARDTDGAASTSWAWIAGIVLVVLVLVLAFGSGRVTDRSATNGANPPTTTGQGTPATQAPAPGRR